MLKIDSISKSYNKGSVKAVDNISLDIKAGEIFGFLGPNGTCELVQLYSKKIKTSLSSLTTMDSSRLSHKDCLSSLSKE